MGYAVLRTPVTASSGPKGLSKACYGTQAHPQDSMEQSFNIYTHYFSMCVCISVNVYMLISTLVDMNINIHAIYPYKHIMGGFLRGPSAVTVEPSASSIQIVVCTHIHTNTHTALTA